MFDDDDYWMFADEFGEVISTEDNMEWVTKF